MVMNRTPREDQKPLHPDGPPVPAATAWAGMKRDPVAWARLYEIGRTRRENSTGESPPAPEAPPAPTEAEPAAIEAEPAATGIAETQEARPADPLMAGDLPAADLPAAGQPTGPKDPRPESGLGRAPSRFKLRHYPGSRRSVAVRYKLYASRMRLRPHLTPKRPTIALCVQFGRPVMRDGLPAYGTTLSVSGAACLGADAGGADISPGVAVSVLLPSARAPLLPTLGHMLGFLFREAGCRPGALPDPLRDGGIDVLLESPGLAYPRIGEAFSPRLAARRFGRPMRLHVPDLAKRHWAVTVTLHDLTPPVRMVTRPVKGRSRTVRELVPDLRGLDDGLGAACTEALLDADPDQYMVEASRQALYLLRRASEVRQI